MGYFLFIFSLIFLSVLVIQPPTPHKLEFKSVNGKPDQYIFTDQIQNQNRLKIILSEALGATLNLDWYDVCFYNGNNVTQYGKPVTPLILEATIYPLQTNKYLLDLQKGLDVFSSLGNNTNDTVTQVISGRRIIASRGHQGCLNIPASEGGFEYALFYLNQTKDQYGTPISIPISLENLSALNPYPLDIGSISDSRQLQLNTTGLYVQTDPYALIIKRLIFVLLAWTLVESILKIGRKIFKQ